MGRAPIGRGWPWPASPWVATVHSKVRSDPPERFVAVGAMEPSVEPTLTTLPNHTRNTWTRGPAPSLGVADNPARLAHDNAAAIRLSGLAIYLEVGDEDYLNLHDGTEFVHRVLWDHDVPHEYHLVRWADHTGASMRPRFGEMMAFIATALAGGRSDPVSFPLTEAEEQLLAEVGRRAAAGEEAPEEFSTYLLGPRGPTVHAQVWSPLRALAEDDPRTGAALRQTAPDDVEREGGGSRRGVIGRWALLGRFRTVYPSCDDIEKRRVVVFVNVVVVP